MYKVVEKYIEKLEMMRKGTFEKYNCVEYGGIKGNVPVEVVKKDRENAIALLLDIFENCSWSDEFVTAFGVFCNFYILTGIHLCLDEEKFGLEKLYEKMDEDEDIQYLEYIRLGIHNQDKDMFWNAIKMKIFDFSIPWLYIYIFYFGQITLYRIEELNEKEECDNFVWDIDNMLEAKRHISKEFQDDIEIKRMPFNELDKILSDMYIAKYLPCIYLLDDKSSLASGMVSDFQMMKKYGNKENIKTIMDIAEGLENAYETDGKNGSYYMLCAEAFFRRMNVIEMISKYSEDEILHYVGRIDGSILERRYFLKLPMGISSEGMALVDYAEQLKLRREKEDLIERNRKMVEDYSHSIENIIKPSLISDIADILKKDDKYKEIYKKLVQIYFSEVTTQNECRLLKMTHDFETSSGAIRENIIRCKAEKIDEEKGVVSFQDLLHKAMNQVIMQIVDDKRNRMEFIRTKIAEAGLDLQLLDSYLWNMNDNQVEAFAFWKDFFNIDFTIDEELRDKYFKEDAVGTTFLFTRMVELLTNLFTYGEYGNKKKFVFDIKLEGEIGERQYIIFETNNIIGTKGYQSGQNGLISMNEMLSRINNYDPDKDVFVESGQDGDFFNVKVYFEAGLYI